MSAYTLRITERQAQILSEACETLARLGMGQFDDALRALPQRPGMDWSRWHDDLREISRILSAHMPDGIDGYRSSLGIHSAAPGAQAAWDLHAVIRHRLSWDRATREGITDGKARNWAGGMMGVNFDAPSHIADEPLAKMEAGPLAGPALACIEALRVLVRDVEAATADSAAAVELAPAIVQAINALASLDSFQDPCR